MILSIALTYLLFTAQSRLPARPPTAGAVDEIIFKGFPFPQKISRAELEMALGKPSSVSEKDRTTLQFNGLTITLAGGTISTIELTDNRWHFPAKLRVGSTRDEMLKLLGKPDMERGSESIYGCYECVYDHKIHFVFDAGRIKRIQWDFYLN
ncbi:MAG TPA: hypothetical protein VKY31_05795 [Terriglobia bacterium]|nr:hypothetical protein [Terriglobia bacterium]